jgi:predicted membrane GTPase involved in stress response
MSGRKGQLLEFKDHRDKSRLVFRIPSRGMVRSPLNLPAIIQKMK